MNDEFKITPSMETVRRYVMPYVLQNNVDIEEVLLDLQTTGVSIPSAVTAAVLNLLLKNDLKKAADLGKYLYNSEFRSTLKILLANN